MRSWLSISLLGLSLSIAACATDDPGPTSPDEQALETATSALVISHPDYYTCSDDTNVCSAGYGSVSILPDASCIPYGASHRVICRWGASSL